MPELLTIEAIQQFTILSSCAHVTNSREIDRLTCGVGAVLRALGGCSFVCVAELQVVVGGELVVGLHFREYV